MLDCAVVLSIPMGPPFSQVTNWGEFISYELKIPRRKKKGSKNDSLMKKRLRHARVAGQDDRSCRKRFADEEAIETRHCDGSQAHLMRASDGAYYVTKFQNSPQGVRILANEMFATSLGLWLGLPMPQPVVIEVCDWLVEHTPELRVQVAEGH